MPTEKHAMCVEPRHRPEHPIVSAIRPEPAVAPIDPVSLSPVDALTLTTLVDNSIDVLLPDQGPVRRHGFIRASGSMGQAAHRDPGPTGTGASRTQPLPAGRRSRSRRASLMFDDSVLITGEVRRRHLSGSAFEPIEPTVDAWAEIGPEAIIPAHCSSWRAAHALAARMPDAYIRNSVGS